MMNRFVACVAAQIEDILCNWIFHYLSLTIPLMLSKFVFHFTAVSLYVFNDLGSISTAVGHLLLP